MKFFYATLLYLLGRVISEEQRYLLKSIRTNSLQNFDGYTAVTIMHFNVPPDTSVASFMFKADQTSYSIFGCGEEEINLYMKYGSIPVINADNSKYPSEFYNASYSETMYLEFTSDTKYHSINITDPSSGSYYAAAFLPHVDPNNAGITQDGLLPKCLTYIDAQLYIEKRYIIDMGVTSSVTISTSLYENETQTFKFFIPEGNDRLILVLKDINFCDNCTEFIAHLYSDYTDNSKRGVIKVSSNTYKLQPIHYHLWAQDNSWYYITLNFTTLNNYSSLNVSRGKLNFEIKAFPTANTRLAERNYFESFKNYNLSTLFGLPKYKMFYRDYLATQILTKEYELVRQATSDSFFFTFDLHPLPDGTVPIAVNITSQDYTTLKFHLGNVVDIGGTMNIILAFFPKFTKSKRIYYRNSEPANHTVVACIGKDSPQIPTWPNLCASNPNGNLTESPIILNKTILNSTAMLPYPEYGWWYVTLKLFCGECIPCNCPLSCKEQFKSCVDECEESCEVDMCYKCEKKCEDSILRSDSCYDLCDCDGPCQRTNATCNSTIIFDFTSHMCVGGSCGDNGKCVFMVTEGLIYSACLCLNKYKGFDCSDNSDATSYGMLVLEMCLLVISNAAFLPATYIAFKRKYYVESIVYFSTFLFSSLYHACDAGENMINYCLVKLGVLQFSDFYSGLLSIWVTLIAMAYLQQPYISILHIAGCILLAFGTTYNKMSIWVFAIPAIIGGCILMGNWIYLSRMNKCLFPSKRYYKWFLPFGLAVVVIALVTFGLFQTQSNYKYLHSLWHILMAVGVVILLPKLDVFLPASFIASQPLNNSNGSSE